MEKYLLPALVANAATLGIHWIYDYKYLQELAKNQSLLFLTQERKHFEAARNSYYSYPNSEVGDVTVQGQMLMWLYQALKNNPDFSLTDYSKLLFKKFKPGGTYQGYTESYAKKHVMNILNQSLNLGIEEIPINDDHLVGFMPYLACKELNLDNKKAWELTNVYSQDESYLIYFTMFDKLFEKLKTTDMKTAVESVITLGPEKYQLALKKAIEMTDTNEFIKNYAGRACPIQQSIPLIIHLLYNSNSYQEIIEQNALIGGAVSDRGMLLGAIMAQVSKIPTDWLNKVISKIKP